MAAQSEAMTSLPRPDLLACDECDLLYRRRTLAAGDLLRCGRCGATLARGHGLGIEGQLALTLSALVMFVVASFSPIVTLEFNGIHAVASLSEAIRDTWQTGERLVAVLATATAFVFPLIVILLRLWLLLPLLRGQRVPGFVGAMRALRWFLRWSMVEVFMLAVLVAVARSAGVSQVVTGPGLYGYAALVLLLTSIQACGIDALWDQAGEAAP
jgi:paraquat-inducible protein A